jgi:hypothetical protein
VLTEKLRVQGNGVMMMMMMMMMNVKGFTLLGRTGFLGGADLAYQGKDIVFRFIIEYSSLRVFYRPLGNNNNNNNRSIFLI